MRIFKIITKNLTFLVLNPKILHDGDFLKIDILEFKISDVRDFSRSDNCVTIKLTGERSPKLATAADLADDFNW